MMGVVWPPQSMHTFLYRLRTTAAHSAAAAEALPLGYLQLRWHRCARAPPRSYMHTRTDDRAGHSGTRMRQAPCLPAAAATRGSQ
jgi:hypothetical protein